MARHALEGGLAIAPKHPLMLEDLAETLLAVGDLDACAHVAAMLLRLDPGHVRANNMRDDAGGLEPFATFGVALGFSGFLWWPVRIPSIHPDRAPRPRSRSRLRQRAEKPSRACSTQELNLPSARFSLMDIYLPSYE